MANRAHQQSSKELSKWQFLTPTCNLNYFGPNAVHIQVDNCDYLKKAPNAMELKIWIPMYL